jgi:LacI family transcriptional regulator
MVDTKRATRADVAREAGVSLATVDRVLNKRVGVHARTVARVAHVVQRLGYRPDPSAARMARARPHSICFVLPNGSNSFVDMLRQEIAGNDAWMADHRVVARTVDVDAFAPRKVAELLTTLKGRHETVVLMAIDHPLVRAAIDELADAGTGVITLVSDVPSSRRHHFVGVDNVAAGRTAATLIGRFLGGKSAEIGVVVGSLSLRDHAERSFGFGQVMAAEYPSLKILSPLEGKDDSRRTRRLASDLLTRHPALGAIYSVGAGNRGIAAALEAGGLAHKVVFVGHELTPYARRNLLSGTMDAVINQDAGREIRCALLVALERHTREPVGDDQRRIGIDIYLKDNLP